jgi:hypothetical protein
MTRRSMMAVAAALLAWGSMAVVEAAQVGRMAPPVQNTAGGFGGNPATGLQLSLFAPAQLFPETYDVSGFRFSLLYGKNANLRGFDLGLVNELTGVGEGFQLGLGNMVEDMSGLQIGLFNSTGTSSGGLCQIGLVNMGKDVRGVQIGVFNMCDTISGVQIGLLNFINQSDFVIFCPIINAQF